MSQHKEFRFSTLTMLLFWVLGTVSPWPYSTAFYAVVAAVMALVAVDAYQLRVRWAFLLQTLLAGALLSLLVVECALKIGYFGVPQYS